MCLAIPARVVSAGPRPRGRVEYLGTKMGADLSLLDDVRVGDWVIIHAGFAIAKLDEEEARQTLDLLREMAGSDSPTPGDAFGPKDSPRPPRRSARRT